eukprot:233634_1
MLKIIVYCAVMGHVFSALCHQEDQHILREINAFATNFDINSNQELQELRNQVIANKCHFGESTLSSSIFSFAPGYINLHCGSYGSQPKYVVKYHNHIRNILYSRPHVWDDVYSVSIMNTLRSKIANYLGINNINDLVFTINASQGLSIVIKSLMDHFLSQYTNNISDFSIIYFNTAHSSFISLLKYYQRLFQIKLIEIKFDEHILKDYNAIINTINTTLNEMTTNQKILFAVFSHVTSLPSMIMPLNDIVTLFNARNIVTVVDGAHAFGQIYNLNISNSNCDFYVSNAYKWFYSVWNTAIIYVKKKYKNIITPLAMSYTNVSFQKLFHHPGTVDESAYLSLIASLEFRYLIGGDKNIINYIHNISIEAQQYLANLWNTDIFMPNHEYFIGMINVELPSVDGVILNKQKIKEIFFTVLEQNDIAFKLFEWNGKFYARISCQIYTNMDQIQQIGRLVNEYLNVNVTQTDELIKQEL